MSPSSFPLLQLPSLALKEIIEMIELKEQFKLSLCSKRMYYNVKYFRVKSTISLKLRDSEDYTEICIFNQESLENEIRFEIRADGGIYCRELDSGKFTHFRFEETERLFSHGKNVIQETKLFVEFLCDLFAAKVEKVSVNANKICILDFIEERQGGYSYDAEVRNSMRPALTDEQSRHILLDLNPRTLEFSQKTSDEFQIENFHKKYKNLTIYRGRWMTVENLCQLDCVEFNDRGRYFSNTEISRYFRHVLSGGAPRLRKFSAAVEHPIENVIMDGIRELLTEIEHFEDELGHWKWNGKVARGEKLALVSIELTLTVDLKIKET